MWLKQVAKEVGVALRGAYGNRDGGFEATRNRKGMFNTGMIPHIQEHPRNRTRPQRGRKRLCNDGIHVLRAHIERPLAWTDPCKRLLRRFERIQQRHSGMPLMAYPLINCSGCCVPSHSPPVSGDKLR